MKDTEKRIKRIRERFGLVEPFCIECNDIIENGGFKLNSKRYCVECAIIVANNLALAEYNGEDLSPAELRFIDYVASSGYW